jgi:molecular chaperone DnaK
VKSLGIDFGTTNTIFAENSRVLSFSNQKEQEILPSVVAFTPNGDILVGEEARNRRAIDPKNTIASSKRLIGAAWHSYRRKQFEKHYPYTLEEAEQHRTAIVTRAGRKTAQELATVILQTASRWSLVDTEQTRAVVSVPASYSADSKKETVEAVKATGYQRVDLIDEPVATAIAYARNTRLGRVVVYDFGGGTFDLAIVDCSKIPFTVVAEAGDEYLGGDNIDRAIADTVADRVLEQYRWDLRSEAMVYDRLVYEAELAKLRLTKVGRVSINPRLVDPAAPENTASVTIDRAELEKICEPWIRRTFYICDQLISRVDLKSAPVQSVLLAGGSSSLPGIEMTVGAYFSCPVRRAIDPLYVVAIGASIAAVNPNIM